MKTSTLQQTALEYILRGWSVIPVGKNKKPLIEWSQFQNRKATEKEITTWWKKYPSANIGIVTGKISNLSVIDIDTQHGGVTPKGLPQTLTAKTQSGGWHYYFQYSEGLRNSAGAIAQGVDVRSEGGFVIAPPSIGEKGSYEWILEEEIGSFPKELLKNVKKTKKLKDIIESPEGHRNEDLAAVVGHLLVSTPESKWKSDAWIAVQAINKTYKPPLPEKDLRTTFNSIAKREQERREKGEAIISPFQISDTDKINISLRRNGNNVPYKDMANALYVLRQHPKYKDTFAYNEFKRDVEFNKKPLTEQDIRAITFEIQKNILPTISKEAVYDAILHSAHENTYDEAKDWLKSLTWDKIPRLETWVTTALGVPDDTEGYIKGVGTQWFMGMVRRLTYPGCIFDHVLVLVGPQGVGKTSVFRILGGEWYKSYTGAVENKDFYIALRGAAIMDLDEGVALYKSESIKIKSIITETHDEYRAPYDKTTQKFPRRFAFSMSTNDTEPFRDMTGNRRYWVVDVNTMVDFKWLEDNREQLFAETYYHLVNKTDLPQVPMGTAREKQEAHVSDDPWEETIRDFLQKHPITTVGEIYLAVISKRENADLASLGRRETMRIADILKKNGFEKFNKTVKGVRKNRWKRKGVTEEEIDTYFEINEDEYESF